jgi:hypothetical protein
LTNEQKLANFYGLSIVIFGTIVVFLATKMDYANEKENRSRINATNLNLKINEN